MKLLYDKNDLPLSKKMRDGRFKWLADLGATELSSAAADEEGFCLVTTMATSITASSSRIGQTSTIGPESGKNFSALMTC